MTLPNWSTQKTCILVSMIEEHKSVAEIAIHLSVSRWKVRSVMDMFGIGQKVKSRTSTNGKGRFEDTLSKPQQKELFAMIEGGSPYAEIAFKFSINETTVGAIKKRNDLTVPKTKQVQGYRTTSKPKPDANKIEYRKCLGPNCEGGMFKSWGFGNRICVPCNQKMNRVSSDMAGV